MATSKSGPVKPPLLDLEARKAEGANTADVSGKKNSAFGFSTLANAIPVATIAAGAIGTLLGATLAFGFAAFGFWPQPATPPNTTSLDIATLERRMDNIEATDRADMQNFSEFEQRINTLEVDNLAKTATDNETLESLKREIADLPQTPGNTPPVDLTPLEAQIAALNARIDAIPANPPAQDTSALSENLAQARTEIAALTTRLAALETAADQSLTAMGDFEEKLTELATRPAPESPPAMAAQLPLALSGFETAIRNGRPYESALQALATALPALEIPPVLAANAAKGLPSPERISRDLANAIPAMLAAKPADPNASWNDKLVDRAKSLLALRPTGAVDGDTPEAIIARLEDALIHQDFIAASALIKDLPQPMRAAANKIPAAIARLAAAQNFTSAARTTALAPPKQPEAENAQ